MRRRLLLIVNPKAGLAQGHRFIRELAKIFSDAGYSVMIHITDSRGDACGITRDYGAQYDTVVCVGGDGTLNEVINGLMALEKKPKLGYIPAGTTNDFAASLNLSRNMTQAAYDIASGREHVIDVGKFDERYFSYIASFGAFTEASYNSSQDLKNTFGRLVYVLEGIKDIANLRSHHIRVESENGVFEGDYIFGAFSNSTSIAGMIKLADSAVDFNDGMFETMLIKMPENLAEVNKIVNSLLTRKYSEDVISFFHSSRAAVTLSEPTAWTVDGEYARIDNRVEICNVRDALTMLY